MRRRALLTTTAVGITTATAGCASWFERPTYERCTASFVPLNEIPGRSMRLIPRSAYDEVKTALEDGAYTALDLQYPDLVSDDTTLWDVENNRYYSHRIDRGILFERLRFDERTPSRENSGELKLSNQTSNTIEATVTISADDEVFVDAELSADPADDVNKVEQISNAEYAGDREAVEALPGVGFPDELREYTVEVITETADDEHVETATIDIHPWFEYYWVQISDEGLLTGTLWENDTGFFFDGADDTKVGVHWECTAPPSGWPEV